jgi:glycosyltransferase involved in cell wall biosynthesis
LRILYFYPYFSTSKGSWGTRVHEFTREWVKENNVSVTVITAVYYKSDIVKTRLIERKSIDGVDVIIIGISINNKDGFFKRILSFLIYSILSTFYALTLKYTIAIASSGPITVGIPGLVSKWIRRKKLVFEVRDLWPQGAIELGVLKNRMVIFVARWFEKICYKSSDLIVALSPGMKREIQLINQTNEVINISNAANLELFGTEVIVDLAKYNLTTNNYAVYAGNIGKVNHVEWLFDVAKKLTTIESKFKIVLIGDGQLKDLLQKRKELEGVVNIEFLPLMPKEVMVGYLQKAMVSLVPLASLPVLQTSSPNKLFESLAAGVPVIQNTNGWIKEFVDSESCGFTVNSEKVDELYELLLELSGDLTWREHYAERAREVAKREFDKNKLAKKFITALSNV